MPTGDQVSSDVEAQVDALYGVPLAEFIAARKRLTDTLKKAGQPARAAKVKSLAKPTRSAWVTNQTVRRNAALLKRLLAATDALAAAQRGLGGGGAAHQDFQAALAEQREVIAQLKATARAVLDEGGQTGSEGVLDAVEKNLRYGPISEEARPAFVDGHLTADVPPPGFGALLGAEVGTGGAPIAVARTDGHAAAGKAKPLSPSYESKPDARSGAAAHGGARPTVANGQAARQRLAREEVRAAAEARKRHDAQVASLRASWREARAATSDSRRFVERAAAGRETAQAKVADAENRLEIARSTLASAAAAHQRALDSLREHEKKEGELAEQLANAERTPR